MSSLVVTSPASSASSRSTPIVDRVTAVMPLNTDRRANFDQRSTAIVSLTRLAATELMVTPASAVILAVRR